MIQIGKQNSGAFDGRSNKNNSKYLVNEQITHQGDVRVIDENGEQLGIMDVDAAIDIAYDRGYDLVEVSFGDIPVCRIMNYSKFIYDQQKREKQARKNKGKTDTKEIKFRCKIADNDLMTKTKAIDKFLRQGNSVRITIMFKGREVTHPEQANTLLNRVLDGITTECDIIKKPEMLGRNMSMTIIPKSRS